MTERYEPAGDPAGDVAEAEARIRTQRLLAVLRLREYGSADAIAETLVECGLGVLEFTLDHPEAIAATARLADRLGPAALLGVGTVTDTAQVAAARDAGARFCVCPHVDPAVIAAAIGAGLVPIPGVATPTELATAQAAGARLIKLFPAGPLGIDYLSALRGPFARAELIPTGGIGVDEVQAWLAAGATAVGLGSSLVERSGTLDGVAERATRAVEAARPDTTVGPRAVSS